VREDCVDAALERAYALLIADAADRDQSEMGARRDDGGGSQTARAMSAVDAAYKRANEIADEDVENQRGDRAQRLGADRSDCHDEKTRRSPRECAHALQCRLARDGGLGYRDLADLSGARQRHSDPCVGRRDTPAQSGRLATAWELGQHGVKHTVIPDNTGGHLMQARASRHRDRRTDRVTAQGDVCNKIGTYLKALAARDNNVPFYVALPSPTIDFTVVDGVAEIPIEQRSADEVTTMTGRTADGRIESVRIVPDGSAVANYGFDVTPARL